MADATIAFLNVFGWPTEATREALENPDAFDGQGFRPLDAPSRSGGGQAHSDEVWAAGLRRVHPSMIIEWLDRQDWSGCFLVVAVMEWDGFVDDGETGNVVHVVRLPQPDVWV